jgi:hypothetical protein
MTPTSRPPADGGSSRSTVRFLSVSSFFELGGPSADSSHWTQYQLDLQGAAERMGVSWEILASETARSQADAVRPVLRTASSQALAGSIGSFLSSRGRSSEGADAVIVYEGNIQLLEEISKIAADHPQTRFVVNFFSLEPEVDAPARRRWSLRRLVQGNGRSAPPARRPPPRVPLNVTVTAETDQLAFQALTVGVPIEDVWRLHSQLATQPAPEAGRVAGGGLKVLVPLGAWQLNGGIDLMVARTNRHLRRTVPGATQVQVVGLWSESGLTAAQKRRVRRLRRAGVRVVIDATPPKRQEYAERLASADVIWLPKVGRYRNRSSGKALDALTVGRPILAPAGTYPATQMLRWIPGMPQYSTAREAAAVIESLTESIGTLHAELERSAPAIGSAYSPENTVRWIQGLVSRL